MSDHLSRIFLPTARQPSQGATTIGHKLAIQAGLIHQEASGIYSMLPFAVRALSRIEGIIRQEMGKAGAQEVSLPLIQPARLWQESGRWRAYGAEMLKVQDRNGADFCVGPTHEEIVCNIARDHINSYRQLPIIVYQIGKKFRDEARPRHGLLRTREFSMKDAYSFDADKSGMDVSYDKMTWAYRTIFRRIGLRTVALPADNGEIGGSASEEFVAFAQHGEDNFIQTGEETGRHAEERETSAQKGIEVGHVFKLGDRYSTPMRVMYKGKDGTDRPVLMGCYGIGVSRLLSAILEQSHDEKGIVWPKTVAPYDMYLLRAGDSPKLNELADALFNDIKDQADVLYDDRVMQTGPKFKDAELLGIPHMIVIGTRTLESGTIDMIDRTMNKKTTIPLTDAPAYVASLMKVDDR